MFISALLTKQFFHGDLFSSTDFKCDMTNNELMKLNPDFNMTIVLD